MRARLIAIIALFAVTACTNTDRPLRELRAAGNGPDEFAVIPQNPLQIPENRSLPTPTPGGTNLADPNPNAEAIAALGGSAAARRAGGIPANDAALVGHASRNGVDPNVRAELAAADEAFRERRKRLNVFNPLGRDRYFPAYAGQSLDAYAELNRLRAAGIRTPTPPAAQATTAQAQPAQRPSRQSCVFTTEGPGNELRRVCTPVDDSDQ
ncbi:DUF3035 domain-containing protein [Yoonia sp. 2307UL14-13]|uniref:DUF3035 domain-containing protein n=1 Tax=Yoonia sp. 2307UL14-13 TaxID=3126506 RepID=UPI0030A47501